MARNTGQANVTYAGWEQNRNRQYTCGYCGSKVTPDLRSRGIYAGEKGSAHHGLTFGEIRTCPHCGQPTFFRKADGFQMPGVLYGGHVEHLPNDVNILWEEARACYSEAAFNACAMVCRKILLHVAEENGLPVEKKTTFVEAVNYLFEKHIMPTSAKSWVDIIRLIGNDANHKIELIEGRHAAAAIEFTQQLLENVYQGPARARAFQTGTDQPSTPADHP